MNGAPQLLCVELTIPRKNRGFAPQFPRDEHAFPNTVDGQANDGNIASKPTSDRGKRMKRFSQRPRSALTNRRTFAACSAEYDSACRNWLEALQPSSMRPLLRIVAVIRREPCSVRQLGPKTVELTARRQLLLELVALGLAVLLQLHDLGDVLIDLRLRVCMF